VSFRTRAVVVHFVALLLPLAYACAAQDQFQPNVPSTLVDRLGTAQMKRAQGDLSGAINDLQSIVTEDRSYYRAQYNLGLALADASGGDKTKLADAIATLEKARDIMEQKRLNDYSIYNSLGWFYQQANRLPDAEKAYKQALQHEQTNSEDTNRRVYTNLGLFYLQTGDIESARKYFEVAENRYNSDSARQFLQIIDKVHQKTKLPDVIVYQAKLSDQDKATSKGLRFVDRVRKESGVEAAVLETLLQDRANFYTYNRRDAEDQPSPGLESTSTNRLEFEQHSLQFAGITPEECLEQSPVVQVRITKDSLIVSKAGH